MATHKKTKNAQLTLGKILFFAAIALIAAVVWHSFTKKSDSKIDFIPNELLSVTMPEEVNSIMCQYKGMNLSFNPRFGIPNWVAWELTADEATGEEPRSNKFYADPDVESCPEPYEYNYSGYDRGHMAPAGDMKWSPQAMAESFCMTNICPQAKKLNTGAWKRLETKCRTWAEVDSAIMIICGPILTDPIKEYIGNDRKVAVPARFFKVILSPYAYPPRGIAFIMPNGTVKGGMQATATTIDEVEQITGFDFFSALPDDIENEVESQCDFHYWSTIRKK